MWNAVKARMHIISVDMLSIQAETLRALNEKGLNEP